MNRNCNSDVPPSGKSSSRRRGFPSSSSSDAKKLKCDSQHQQQEKEDMISNLPDSLLHHIFSFLDIKDAVHTCLLSRRWRYFWISIPTLNFLSESGRIPVESHEKETAIWKLTDFVNRVLMLRDNSNIHRFAITCRIPSQDDVGPITSNLDTWILIAVLRNVEELLVDVSLQCSYRLPRCLSTCKSLTKLKIHCHGNNEFVLPDKISLPRLKTLYLDSVDFGNECLSYEFSSNCPNLESLVLCGCSYMRSPNGPNINICSLKLKELVLRNNGSNSLWFNLNAPNLISFHYYDLIDISTFGWEEKEMCVQHMMNILKKLRNVEDLILSAPYLQFLTGAPDLLDSTLTEFCNLRSLMLTGSCFCKDFNQAVSHLLKLSPNIKTLGLTTCVRDDIFDDGDWETEFSSDSNCAMMNHLTVFELQDVKGRDYELEFIEVLLKNAKVLEKLVIDFGTYLPLSSKTKKFKKTVLALPRASLSTIILFK